EVTFTATVTAVTEGSGQPSGVVVFSDGETTIGMGKLSGPTASITVSNLAVGEHPITASYSGDAVFVGSSDNLDQVVDAATTTVALTSSVNPSGFGQEVVFTATLAVVPPGAGTPTGTLTFLDGETELGSSPVVDGGASLSTTELAVGSHAITVAYGGDGSFAPASSPILTQTVDTVSTITMLSSSANPSIVGQPVVFTVTVMSAIESVGPPTGAVTFEIDGEARDTVELVEGTAEYTTSQFGTSNLDPGLGDHLVVARYEADGGFEASDSPDLTQSVQYDFTGYLPPLATAGSLANPGSSGSAALGSVVPVSWQIQLGNGIFVGNTSTVARLEAIGNADCAGPPEGPSVVLVSPEGGIAEGSEFAYLGEEQRFLFSWDTSTGVDSGAGCYSLVLELIDGSVRATVLELTGAVTGKRAAELPGSMTTEGQSAVEPPRP
nr:Ig-like domain repeat protein [Actinomycetota bacterium]